MCSHSASEHAKQKPRYQQRRQQHKSWLSNARLLVEPCRWQQVCGKNLIPPQEQPKQEERQWTDAAKKGVPKRPARSSPMKKESCGEHPQQLQSYEKIRHQI
jgi:hypothetical protein